MGELFPNIHSAYRLGRLLLHRAMLGSATATASCHLYIGNDGETAWANTTVLQHVSGADFGLRGLLVGEVPPGSHVELNLRFQLLDDNELSAVEDLRSAWVLEAGGRPFGPLLLLELSWV